MILRWIGSLLIFLIAAGGMMQHGQTAEAGNMPDMHIVVSMTKAVNPDAQDDRTAHQSPSTGMSDLCAIICLGTPTHWLTAAPFAPVETERSLKRQFAAVTHEGRLVGPGYRPPRSI